MKTFRHAILLNTMLLPIIAVSPAAAQTKAPPPHAVHPAFLNYKDLKWEKLRPQDGEASAEIAILHVNPQSGATQLFIRSPKNDHAPRHWHSANETHLVVYGHFIMKVDGGQKEDLGPYSFNYMPSKLIHEAWSTPDEGNMVFITVDGPWDLNLVEGPKAKLPPVN
jgi:quercetin dioxygenase-like cupin family protein